MRLLPRFSTFIKEILIIDMLACFYRAWLWSDRLSDYSAQGMDRFFPTLTPLRLGVGLACIAVPILADFLLLLKSRRGFIFAWLGMAFVALEFLIAVDMQLMPDSPVSPANSAEALGLLVHFGMVLVFNLILLMSLLRLKREWEQHMTVEGTF